ncbi:MAG: hypothetical protein K8R58_09700, partial [Bacteroidales bacterium]|nr:hypothetical protein [Bacteroidales bacterium]
MKINFKKSLKKTLLILLILMFFKGFTQEIETFLPQNISLSFNGKFINKSVEYGRIASSDNGKY